MTTNKELLEIRENETPRGVGTQTTVFSERALNAELWDVEGKRYIDLASGIAVTNTGHNHPAVIAATVTFVSLYANGDSKKSWTSALSLPHARVGFQYTAPMC